MKEVIYKFSHEFYSNLVFNDHNDVDCIPSYHPRKKNKETFTYKSTNNDQDFFVKNYGNPLCDINKKYILVVVEKNGDKVSLKLFSGSRQRRAGVFWFKVVKNVYFLTVNVKTGDVYSGSILNYQKKRKFTRTLRRNNFNENPLQAIKANIKNSFSILCHDGFAPAKESIDILLKELDGGRYSDSIKDTDRLFKFYLDKRNIKYPNNFGIYANVFKSKDFKKNLKKNDLKVVESFMITNNLSGKKIKKSLHSCVNLNISLLSEARKFFGDWINQEEDSILKCLNYSSNSFFFGIYGFGDSENFSKEELKRIYKIFKLTFFELELDEYTLRDHIHIYLQLKRYNENNVKWLSTNISEFRKEHLDWSNTLEFYKRGEYDRIYPKHYYDILKKPISVENELFFPVILDKTLNYNEESDVQSNCVKTYIGRSGSIIISLRKDSPDSIVRATVQYELTKEKDGINIMRVQFRGRFNASLEEWWSEALLKLDKLMLSCVKHKNYKNVKITKKCANGIVLESDSEWVEENGKLRWTYKEIEHEF